MPTRVLSHLQKLYHLKTEHFPALTYQNECVSVGPLASFPREESGSGTQGLTGKVRNFGAFYL